MANDSAFATASLADTLAALWVGDPSAKRIRVLADEMRVIAQRNNGRVFLYNVITDSTPVPTGEARAELQTQFNSMRGQLLGTAIVLEKLGVEGTLSRAVLTTLITITRQPFPMKIFSLRRDGAVWLGTLGCAAGTSALVSQAQTLENRLRMSTAHAAASG